MRKQDWKLHVICCKVRRKKTGLYYFLGFISNYDSRRLQAEMNIYLQSFSASSNLAGERSTLRLSSCGIHSTACLSFSRLPQWFSVLIVQPADCQFSLLILYDTLITLHLKCLFCIRKSFPYSKHYNNIILLWQNSRTNHKKQLSAIV